MENKVSQLPSLKNESEIVESWASGMYLTDHTPKVNLIEDAPPIQVGTASGEAQRSSSTCELAIPNLSADFPVSRHVMPGFQENLVGIGPICDAD